MNVPFQVRSSTVSKRLCLAPMAGIGHIAFRHLLSEFGGYGLLFMGMCNAKAVPHENRFKSQVFCWRNEELPYLVCQLFGSKPEDMATAAKRVEQEGFFGVDLNFGCSVAAICKKNCGAALLKSPDLAIQIVSAVRKAVSLPIFVKYRTGWQDDPAFPVLMAKSFESAGADALVFHPRVAPDRRTRPPKWEYIAKVKQSVHIPVIGNGNVVDEADCERMFQTTQCDAIALGRIAIAKPWIFSTWTNNSIPPEDIHLRCVTRYHDLLRLYFEPHIALLHFKRFANYFCANFTYGHMMFKTIRNIKTWNDMETHCLRLFSPPIQLNLKPNQNFF